MPTKLRVSRRQRKTVVDDVFVFFFLSFFLLSFFLSSWGRKGGVPAEKTVARRAWRRVTYK